MKSREQLPEEDIAESLGVRIDPETELTDTQLLDFWQNFPDGLLIGRAHNEQWQAGFQTPGMAGRGVIGDSPRECLRQMWKLFHVADSK